MDERLYTVGELASELGTTPRALRFYEDKGLVCPNRAGNTRIYSHRDRARLLLVLRGKRLGFSLREIREWLSLYDADPNRVTQTRYLLDKLDSRIRRLEQQRRDLDRTLAELAEIRAQAEAHLRRAGAPCGPDSALPPATDEVSACPQRL